MLEQLLRLLKGVGIVAIAAVVLGGATLSIAAPLDVRPLEITTARGDFHFKVEIADTDRARERGLMFRRHLSADRGMLFDFKTPQSVSFWMKNTLIPLDMVFIGADGRVVAIARNAKPKDETGIGSGGPVLGVLEIAGGRAAQIGAAPGDKVREAIFPP